MPIDGTRSVTMKNGVEQFFKVCCFIRRLFVWHVFRTYALLFSLSLLTGCVHTKMNVTVYRIENTKANKDYVKKSVAAVAQEFGFSEKPQWLAENKNAFAAYTYPDSSWGAVPYSITAGTEMPDCFFSAEDITNLELFVARLKQPTDADKVSGYLTSQLSLATKTSLATYAGGTSLQLQKALAIDLNHIVILKGPIFDPQRFAGVRLSADTLDLLNRKPRGPDLDRLNQLLLQEVYPREIRRMEGSSIRVDLAHGSISGKKTAKYMEVEQRLTHDFKETFGSGVQISTNREIVPLL